jgi:hypothetical protein
MPNSRPPTLCFDELIRFEDEFSRFQEFPLGSLKQDFLCLNIAPGPDGCSRDCAVIT